MDIDFVNYGDSVKLLKSLGYPKFKRLKWYDFVDDDLERGLHLLEGDAEINEMCDQLMRNIELANEFHVYVEHEIDVPVPSDEDEFYVPPVEIVVLDKDKSYLSSYSDDGGYESDEDELYKSRPEEADIELDSDEETAKENAGEIPGKRSDVRRSAKKDADKQGKCVKKNVKEVKKKDQMTRGKKAGGSRGVGSKA
ncbi:hypothetical protein PIB30_016595 [Stylosanthes scabra]|uniref:PB1-like domain-containing protein n=1 Tax=Stylosanthes scabra TaxID=79078 RepID=A0ABU6T7P6_9FABA|nr:hypothetical protein [Stylosanthes scabra]